MGEHIPTVIAGTSTIPAPSRSPQGWGHLPILILSTGPFLNGDVPSHPTCNPKGKNHPRTTFWDKTSCVSQGHALHLAPRPHS